jgi:UPF0042 nucleotide-binding protein
MQVDGKIDRIAIVIDIRGGEFFDDLFSSLEALKKSGYNYEILFLDANDEVLVKRYKESRRKHPLSPQGRVLKGIKMERAKLKEVKERADNIIDTSNMATRELREKISEIYQKEGQLETKLMITVLSFGFKYGIPVDSDLVFDVRFLPNPFYIQELKHLSGEEEAVKSYVFSYEETKVFIEKLLDMLRFLIPNYLSEGKRQLIIAIGCTGGRHRSVAIARALQSKLLESGYEVNLEHRDIDEDVNNKGGKKL